ncbi:MAG: M56 family metallopeptidase [Clostridiales bacterium]|nr:M56 family metallopeptidase [Clostridiales bacterium]
MKTVLLCVLSTSAALSLITLVCLVLSPMLEKRYSPKGLYTAAVVLMLGFLVPFSLLIPKPLVTVELPTELSQPLFYRPAITWSAGSIQTAPATEAVTGSETAASAIATAVPTVQEALPAPAPIQATEQGILYEEAPSAGLWQRLRNINWLSLLGWVWLGGAIVTLMWQLLRHRCFLRTLRRWREHCGNTLYLHTLSEVQEDMGIERSPALFLCPGVPSPMLIGLKSPAIYLPDEALTADELALVLRHELTHYQRRDLLVKAALLLCRAIHWFNPIMLPLSRWLCYCQEASCDSCVTHNASQEERRFYSETIIRVIRRQVQARTQLCTSFYGGKEGMKKRILSIMNTAKRRAGVVLCICLLAATLVCGGALALDGDMLLSFPQAAWVQAQNGTGAYLLTCPSANDLSCPMGIYLNGTPVIIEQVVSGGSLKEWGQEEGELNWAEVLIGGDGYEQGIHGWMPLRDLAHASAERLPAATLKAASDSGYTDLYAINDRESEVTALRPGGTEVRVLGQLNHWLHVALEEESYFVLLTDTELSQEADKRLWELLPERFGGTTRIEYDAQHIYSKLLEEKQQVYGDLDVIFWSVADKAYYGELEEQYVGMHDLYYLLPGKDDMTEQEAVETALAAYAKAAQLETVTTEQVDVYPGFYRIGYTEPTYWDVIITFKGSYDYIAWVVIDNATGEVLNINGTAPELIIEPMVSPEGNG